MNPSTSFRDSILRPDIEGICRLVPGQHTEFLVQQAFHKQPQPRLEESTHAFPPAGEPTRSAMPSQERASYSSALVRLPSLQDSHWKVTVLQRWVGRVERVKDEMFVAMIFDETNTANPVEEVELAFCEVSESDRGFILEGATFYWSIGYRDTAGGQRERISTLRFARQPRISNRELARIFEHADRSVALFESD